jgi:hypothetical protein
MLRVPQMQERYANLTRWFNTIIAQSAVSDAIEAVAKVLILLLVWFYESFVALSDCSCGCREAWKGPRERERERKGERKS